MSVSMLLFGCSSVLTVVTKRKAKFLDDYLQSYNILCRLFAHAADKEKRNCNAALELWVVTMWIFRPPVRSNGRTYKMLVMFFFFSNA